MLNTAIKGVGWIFRSRNRVEIHKERLALRGASSYLTIWKGLVEDAEIQESAAWKKASRCSQLAVHLDLGGSTARIGKCNSPDSSVPPPWAELIG